MIRRQRLYLLILMLGMIGCASTPPPREEPVVELPPPEEKKIEPRQPKRELPPPPKTMDGSNMVELSIYPDGKDDWEEGWAPSIRKARISTMKAWASATAPAEQDAAGNPESQIRETRGFRIQLANVMEESEARWIELQAHDVFPYVYMLYSSPNYKIRVGNYKTRAEADAALVKAKDAGFRRAWVVPSKVLLGLPDVPDSLRIDQGESVEVPPGDASSE